MKYSFENLEVWQASRELVKDIYQVTSTFPPDEKFGLTRQLRIASLTVSKNIEVGITQYRRKDQSGFYEIAFGSLIEVLNKVILATYFKFLKEEQSATLNAKIDHIGRMLNTIHQSTIQSSGYSNRL
jgi:four helix bundle protein